MHEVKAFIAFLAGLNVLTYDLDGVTLANNDKVDAETLALKSGADAGLVNAVLKVFANLTAPKSAVMKAVAEAEGMDDFFVASISEYGAEELTFTLYGTLGSVYKTTVPVKDLVKMAAATAKA